jgi:PAS domain S-box-containing protein
MRIVQRFYFRFGIALFFIGIALVLSLLSHESIPESFLFFFLAAVMLAGWFGRTGAGLFAVMVSMITVGYYFIPPYRAFAVELDELPYFFSFLSSALVTSWLGSARRNAEEKQRAHLDELFEQSPEAIMLIDLQDRVLRINKEFTSIFGFTFQEIVHLRSIDLITPASLKSEAVEVHKRLSDGRPVNVETIRMRKDGSYLDVSEVSFPVVADGKCIAYYVIFRDITQSKRALDELHIAQAELAHLSRITTMGELASSIAHEINQPIGAIATNGNAAVRWLGQTPPNVEGAEEALDCIIRDANRAADVIGRIRALLKKNTMPMSNLDVNEVIREVLVLTSYETSRREVSVTAELDEGLPHVSGDRVQLQQVILNLVMNGLEAMSATTDRPRQLRIRSTRAADSIQVQVRDSGRGWDMRHFTSVFDPFFTTKTDGIGMGLTISRSIIESHGGRLWAEQDIPNGAVLNFTLPTI